MNDLTTLNTLEKILLDGIKDSLGIEDDQSAEFKVKYAELFKLSREACEESSLAEYKAKNNTLLAAYRKQTKGFETGVFERWELSFNHLEMMWSVAQELGEAHVHLIKAAGGKDDNAVMEALAHLFPRALLVAQEIICLLKGGFPDGALARWRSLHELSITAMYIAKHGEDVAIPYLLSSHFAARRGAVQMNRLAGNADQKMFSDTEMKEFDTSCTRAERMLGRKISKDSLGEWPRINEKHNNFADIEKDVGMDMLRPQYKWASTHTHAHHRPMDNLLGMAEGDAEKHLVSASNSGFVGPLQMVATTLAQITATYLLHVPNPDRVVHSNIMLKLAEEMLSIAIEDQRSFAES